MQLRRMFQRIIPNNNVRNTKEYEGRGEKQNFLLWKVFYEGWREWILSIQRHNSIWIHFIYLIIIIIIIFSVTLFWFSFTFILHNILHQSDFINFFYYPNSNEWTAERYTFMYESTEVWSEENNGTHQHK